jgi:signal transduction histidine kinase
MRLYYLLLVLLWVAGGSAICFAQGNSRGKSNTLSKKADEPLAEVRIVPSKLDSVFQVLQNATAHSQKADISFAISRYYADRLKIDSALLYSERIKEESLAGNYELGLAKHYISRAHALFFRNVSDQQDINKAIGILAHYKDPSLSGFAFRIRARLQLLVDDFTNARKNFHIAINYFAAARQTISLQYVYYELGNSFSQAFETDSAAYYLIIALQLAEQINEPARIFTTAGALGEVYHIADDLENAVKYFKYALENRTPGITKILVRNQLGNYANCLLKLADFKKAEPVIKEYESINEKIGDDWGIIMLSDIKGKYNYHRRHFPEALSFLRTAYHGMNGVQRNSIQMKSIAYFLGKTELQLGQYDSAIHHFSYALQLSGQLKFGSNVLDGNLYISQSYERKGKMDSALYYLRHYDRLKDSLWTFRKEKAVIELTTKYESEKKEHRIQLLQRERELNVYQLRSKMDEIERQKLMDAQKSQQLALLSQQNEISRLEVSEKKLAFDNQQKEMLKKQDELFLVTKEKELQEAIAAKQGQVKNFALFAIVAVLLFSAYVLYRYLQNKKLSNKLAVSLTELRQAQQQLIKIEKEKEAENVRVRISQDIHDEVGATLSGVALFSEIAKEKMRQHKQEDVMEYLEHISVNSKEMVGKMSDIVWAIDPVNDSIGNMIEKLQAYTANLCVGRNINLHTNVYDVLQDYQPSMEVKRNLYLFIKETVNNAVKHSGCKNIWLSVTNRKNIIEAEITDDGIGFDQNQVSRGNGLNNMKARAVNLDGKLTVESGKTNGTTIRLQFDFHPSGGEVQVV